MEDPREIYGIEVEQAIKGPFRLVPSRHMTPDTGGSLDYGLAAYTLDGRPVIIGELFAAGIWMESPNQRTGSGKIRLNTGQIGEWLCQILNAHAEQTP